MEPELASAGGFVGEALGLSGGLAEEAAEAATASEAARVARRMMGLSSLVI